MNGGGTGTTGAGAGVDDDGGRSTVAAKDVAATADTTPTPSFKVGSAPLALEPDPMEEPMERSMQVGRGDMHSSYAILMSLENAGRKNASFSPK